MPDTDSFFSRPLTQHAQAPCPRLTFPGLGGVQQADGKIATFGTRRQMTFNAFDVLGCQRVAGVVDQQILAHMFSTRHTTDRA
ncbi:MAG TPA: hypothetical protein VI485_06385 [Vicinamibacterales bacterium]|nr:hypothetical protein [Vicinamibacterales bacterium]